MAEQTIERPPDGEIKKTPFTVAERQARRRALLDAYAVTLGFPRWGKFETAVINGKIHVMVEPPAADVLMKQTWEALNAKAGKP